MGAMRHRGWVAGATMLIVVAAVFVVMWMGRERPKVYKGKTAREWLRFADAQVGFEQQREEANWALVQIGPSVVPELERILAWRQPSQFEKLRNWAVRLHIVKPPDMHPHEMQRRAAEAAHSLAERGNIDISRLIPHLEHRFMSPDGNGMSESGRALARAGPRGIAILTNLLFNGPKPLRDEAGWSLHHVKSRPEVIAALIRSAKTDPDAGIRVGSLAYLRSSRAPSEEVVPLALEFLRSTNAYYRRQAVYLLNDYRNIEAVSNALAGYHRSAERP